MKLLLLKILFINQPKDKGYVIPIVFALGLIMTLVGTISIFQSSDEQIISISQRQSSEALAAAETGIARYREAINKYKIISMYNRASWNNPTANATATPPGIPNLDSYCPPLDLDATPIAPSGITVAETVEEDLAITTWQTYREYKIIPQSTVEVVDQYRLIDYTYDSGALASDGTYNSTGGIQPKGTLIVEGRVKQKESNKNSFVNDPGATVARIAVELPIQPGLPNPDGVKSLAENLNNFNPALWITGAPDANNINLGSMQVDGNVVVSDGDCVHSGDLPEDDDFVDTTENSVVINPISPSIVLDPVNISNPIAPNPRTAPTPYLSEVRPVKLSELDTLPLSGDTPVNVDGDDIYYYKLVDVSGTLASPTTQDLTLNAGDEIDIRDNRKVVLFVQGDLILNANGGDIEINSAPNNSSHLEIYMTNDTSKIDFQGDGNIDITALIHAPDSPVNVFGSRNVSLTGALWVEDFNGNANGSFSINSDDQYLNYSYVSDFLVNSDFKVADPIIAPPLEWNTQQTQ